MDQQEFDRQFKKAHEEKSPNYDDNVNVALVGKVSAGKSSLLNAIMGCDRSDPIAKVGASSGVTTTVTPYRLDEHVLIIDCPGLDDVRKENSDTTKAFLDSIDVGIFVVTGSSDASQKANYQDLKASAAHVLVVLNKADEWDDLEPSAFDEVVEQWRLDLGADKIYPTCAKGYDPKMRKDAPMVLRGIEEIREVMLDFLAQEKKALLMARHLRDKNKYALGIIAAALVSVGGEAFIPGSAVYITATQVVAISSLHYLYTGSVLSKSSALTLLPTFAGESIGTTAFLWAKSFLPPTGVVDVAAAVIAVVITFAMLAAVKYMLESGHGLDETELLKRTFKDFRKVGEKLKGVNLTDLKSKEGVTKLLTGLLN